MNQAETILAALGGWDNIRRLEACITRIRADVLNDEAIDEAALRKAGAFGVVTVGDTVQVVMGPETEAIVATIEALR
ncbi:glucose PTS transporter subunit EIIB [Schaalia hyovaginalis]|uniref:glucose PTS transporter subunit EIIB n=1 Tax=Schaalia hyovaginalis TaxID=29316 RepID=UPI002A810385|nr:glucose PTS transporter subunit EIIB [Schaalia hyovaginalis]MDY3665444.1 glucose PTS transporter subunit EIIB [Schaalia hyovaginalis]